MQELLCDMCFVSASCAMSPDFAEYSMSCTSALSSPRLMSSIGCVSVSYGIV